MCSPVESANSLTVKRWIKVPRGRVFHAWTAPDEFKQWFGPETCHVLSAQLDARVGGEYRVHLHSEVMGEMDLRGVFHEVSPPSQLVFTWNWDGNPQLQFGETRVTVEFFTTDGGTDIHITHDGLPNAAVRDHHNHGWNGCLDKLEKALGQPCRQRPLLGSFCWNELLTSDVPGATEFYSRLLDWQPVDFPQADIQYTIFKKHDRNVAGLMKSPVPSMPSHWLGYVHVEDVDLTAKKAAALGGKVLNPPFDVPTVGRIAVLQDVAGAAFGIFTPAQA